jgi:hypothetical protein
VNVGIKAPSGFSDYFLNRLGIETRQTPRTQPGVPRHVGVNPKSSMRHLTLG